MTGTTSDFKRKIITILDQVFPEYDTVFLKAGIFGKASNRMLLGPSTKHLMKFLPSTTCSSFENRLGIVKAVQLKQTAQSSFGIKFVQEAFTFQLLSMIEQVKVLEQ